MCARSPSLVNSSSPSLSASNLPTVKSRPKCLGISSVMIGRRSCAEAVQITPLGLCRAITTPSDVRTGFPSTVTSAPSGTRSAKEVTCRLLIRTRPAWMSSSVPRREPRPAAAKNRLRRIPSPDGTGFGDIIRVWFWEARWASCRPSTGRVSSAEPRARRASARCAWRRLPRRNEDCDARTWGCYKLICLSGQ